MMIEGKLDWVCFFGIIGRDFLERGFIMFEKVNRSGLIIYLYYNRDAKNCRIMEILPIIPRNIVTYNSMFQLKKWSNWSDA